MGDDDHAFAEARPVRRFDIRMPLLLRIQSFLRGI
jgi:hypothetical protein